MQGIPERRHRSDEAGHRRVGRSGRRSALALVVTSALVAAGCSSSASTAKTLPPQTTSTTSALTVAPTAPVTTRPAPTTTTTIARTTTQAPVVTTPAPRTTAAPTTPATVPTVLELSGSGIGLSSFDADPDQSIQYVTSILGPPTSDSGWVDAGTSPFGVCTGTSVRGVRWGDLLLLYGDLAAADGIRAFFGFSLGSLNRTTTGKPAGVRTAKGITLGSTVADVRAAYPDVTIADGQPPTFDIPEPSLGGTLSDVAQSGIVTSIYGGRGCEA